MRIYVTNLDKVTEIYGNATTRFEYVGGEKIDRFAEFSAWFDLPMDKIGRAIYETLGCSSEFEVTDLDCGFEIDEYSIWEFNNDAILLENYDLTGEQEIVVNALMDDGDSLETALENAENYKVIEDVDDMAQLGAWLAEDMNLEVDYDLMEYVRWEDFADDNVWGNVIFYGGCCVLER